MILKVEIYIWISDKNYRYTPCIGTKLWENIRRAISSGNLEELVNVII